MAYPELTRWYVALLNGNLFENKSKDECGSDYIFPTYLTPYEPSLNFPCLGMVALHS